MHVSSNVKPRNQCIVTSDHTIILGFISRSHRNQSAEVMLKLYLVLVRPHLGSAVHVAEVTHRFPRSYKEKNDQYNPGTQNLNMQRRTKRVKET